MNRFNTALNSLLGYIEKENYHGWDPYDALTSPFFKLPILKKNKFLRFSAQQVVKRFPVNLRHLLLIKKGYNPISLGLCIQGYSHLVQNPNYKSQREKYIKKIEFLVNELDRLKSFGYSGSCWGNAFDWEARVARIPAYSPSVVITGFIVNALYTYWKIAEDTKSKDLLISASTFVLNNLNRTYEKDAFCFSYSPFDEQKVLNATMKGSRILAQTYSINADPVLLKAAKNSVQYVINKQNENGSWIYSDKRNKIDNYHTGYVLDCLDEYIKCTNDKDYYKHLEKGFEFYKNNFFEDDGFPKFFNDEKYPVDCTAGAQAILTLLRFNENEMAENVAEFLIRNMQDDEGFFYFRKFKRYTIKTSYMRWSQAWMFAALSKLVKISF